MTSSTFDLDQHLATEHKVAPFKTYLKEIVYGGNDGIVTTFTIVAGFAGAQLNPISQLPVLTVLLFGFANLFADGISMAVGNFMSSRSEQDVYRHTKQKEQSEILNHPEQEEQESMAILTQKGFTPKQASDLVAIYRTNTPYWTDFMMNQELKLANPEEENSVLMALATFFSFVVFGFIPLTPYVFFRDIATFNMSIGATVVALVLLGIIRWKMSQQGFIRSLGEILLLGGIAATVAYLVGTLFKI
jgi:vacuolar iron transporter family protein